MKVAATDVFFGYEAKPLRALFRYIGDWDFTEGLVTEGLNVTPAAARDLALDLLAAGWITESERPDPGWYQLTVRGRGFALASLAPPLKRATAERKIQELLGRVRTVNSNPYYLFRVVRVLLFGSMLGEADRVGDVDLVVELESKIEDRDERTRVESARIREAMTTGRRFSNIVSEIAWPQQEVLLFLKSRSRGLSFHDAGDGILDDVETRQLFP